MFYWLIIYLDLLSFLICLILFWLLLTLFLLASFFVCLLTLRLSINIKRLRLFFHSLPILTDFLQFGTPILPPHLFWPLRCLLDVTKISDPPTPLPFFYFFVVSSNYSKVFYRGYPLSTCANFSVKLTFLTLWYAHVRVRIRGLEMLVFRKILRMY